MSTLIERIKLLDSLKPKVEKWSEWSVKHLPSCRPSHHHVNIEKSRHRGVISEFIRKSVIQTGGVSNWNYIYWHT